MEQFWTLRLKLHVPLVPGACVGRLPEEVVFPNRWRVLGAAAGAALFAAVARSL